MSLIESSWCIVCGSESDLRVGLLKEIGDPSY